MITTGSDGIKEVTPPLSDADVESLKAGDRVRVTGVMYTAPWWTDESELDARVPLSVAPWHQHVNLCVPPGRRGSAEWTARWTERRNGRPLFGPRSPIATKPECEAVGGTFVERLFGWMVHVDAFAAE